jgi:putative membrane protein
VSDPAPPAPAPGPAPPGAQDQGARLADGEWHRVHPLSPAIRSWQLVVFILVVAIQNVGGDLFRGDVLDATQASGRILAGGTAIVVVAVAMVIGIATLSWRMTRFRVTQDALELNSGVLNRQQRRARLDRLQAVDVVQPLVARIAGLARITLEVAGGSGSAVTLSYLTEAQATSLRNHLLARAAGLHYETDEAPEAPEHHVVDVPAPRLIGSLLLSGPAIVAALAGIAAIGAAAGIGRLEPVFTLFPILIGTVSVLWARFNGGFGFRVATSPDGLRLRHGLLEQRAQTVPPGRVQAVSVKQPLLWRGCDWWSVEVNVAGYGGGSDDARSTETTLLPVGTRGDALAVLSLVQPELSVEPGESPAEVVVSGLVGEGPAHGYITVPRNARFVDPVAYRRTGARVTREALLIRRGRLVRRLDVVPHARSQSWGLTQGPLQRRLGLASFALHSTPGPVTPQVPHLAAGVAATLLSDQTERARHARAAAGPERWMEARLSGSATAPASPVPPADPPRENPSVPQPPAAPGSAGSSPA